MSYRPKHALELVIFNHAPTDLMWLMYFTHALLDSVLALTLYMYTHLLPRWSRTPAQLRHELDRPTYQNGYLYEIYPHP